MEFNKVFIVGNLTRDPELRMIPSGTAVCNLGIASNRKYKRDGASEFQEETTFVDVTVWGRQAEISNQYLSKGSGVLLEGRLKPCPLYTMVVAYDVLRLEFSGLLALNVQLHSSHVL